MKISVVTVNFNNAEATIKMLKSLADQLNAHFNVFVVDNGSDDSDFAVLKDYAESHQNSLQLLRSEENLGFSGGCNLGVKKALEIGSEWVILLNNDTLADKGFITHLSSILEPKEGVVGVPLDEGGDTAYCGKIEWLKPALKHVYSVKSGEDFYAIGGAVAIRREVFEKIGFLDEKYFLYFEDADFSIKARNAGFELKFLQEPAIRHQVSSSTKKLGSPTLLRYHYRNALYFNLKNGPWYVKILVWPWSLWILIKQSLKIFFFIQQDKSIAILRGVFDFYFKKMGKIG